MKLWRNWGLQARLLLAFALLSVVTASAVAGIGYVRARDAIVQQAQDSAVVDMTNKLQQMYPLRTGAPDPAQLNDIVEKLRGRTVTVAALAGSLYQGDLPVSDITPELRAKVGSGQVAWQRIAHDGVTALVIGSQLQITGGSKHAPTFPSGIEVYELRTFENESETIAGLARDAWLTGGGGLLLAMLLALLAARSVLRPVHELQRAAHRLGEGDLDTRLTVRGGDELAAVAGTFNSTAESLQKHVGELRRMEADARRFVADVSHELRTPLAAMTAVTDMLDAESERLPGVSGQAVRLVSRETHNLTRLVNDLIEVTRFDSGTASLALDDIDLAEAIRMTLRTRGFTDEVQADLPDGIRARVDPRRLDVIVANLVGNALRHGETPVTVRLTGDAAGVRMEVADSGPGLDEEVLPHVFQRFYKADSARGRSEGSGLGLAISWENTRLHGGQLTAANAPGGGAVFAVWLPRTTEVEQ
ncbi:two-component system sensor histidine kinase MtrB [Amycolatopsis sulphurea]|uniref:Signal transduction histidine-protein kinase/phosphatase MprB n=1 Tax=Amycolatopsis sulphurea TaxID=76022 RepID=A0A2A9G1M4_9PSEU|nr:HAMP domain-containing sensor histidine kinase [Amycolatopsis sulphurea]PFG56811.1 two-component system sensor histidine kinase MtrB [Amycolatopsis sulphurea]